MINYTPLFLLFQLLNFEKFGKPITALLIIFICSILIIVVYFIFLKKRISHKSPLEKSIIKNSDKKSAEPYSTSGIASEVITEILVKLDAFEKNRDYLDKDLCLPKLASTFKTNTSYLSKTINCHKGKSFTTYVNHLRIDYIVAQLKEDSIYRKYTIKALSEISGFNSTQQFSDAFNERTGFRPSLFTNEIAKMET